MTLREYCLAILAQLDKTQDIYEEIRLLKVFREVINDQIDARISRMLK